MNIELTPLSGCVVIKPRIFTDDRGYFFEVFNEEAFHKAIDHQVHFVQDNQSYSTRGVLRGIHLQKGKHAQAKLVRVVTGEALDIAIDLRKSSPTYGQHFSIRLSEENNYQFFIPRGFGHGFLVLSDHAIFQYKVDNYYNREAEGGLHYADPGLNIDWGLDKREILVSEKDLVLPFLTDAADLGY